ncbi:MAG TPA: hypothetical protein ACFYD4_12355 [Candidatus Wunengus sp. YC61]
MSKNIRPEPANHLSNNVSVILSWFNPPLSARRRLIIICISFTGRLPLENIRLKPASVRAFYALPQTVNAAVDGTFYRVKRYV